MKIKIKIFKEIMGSFVYIRNYDKNIVNMSGNAGASYMLPFLSFAGKHSSTSSVRGRKLACEAMYKFLDDNKKGISPLMINHMIRFYLCLV